MIVSIKLPYLQLKNEQIISASNVEANSAENENPLLATNQNFEKAFLHISNISIALILYKAMKVLCEENIKPEFY